MGASGRANGEPAGRRGAERDRQMSGDLAETRCDLCDANDWEVLAEDCPDNCRVVLCRRCSLMQAFPRLAPAELDTFYDEVFSFDYGAPAKAAGGLPDPGRLASEEQLVGAWGLPILKRHVDLKDKRVLDLRCRSAALTAAIAAEGAEVVAVEPFAGNVNHAIQIRSLACVRQLPFSRFHELPLDELGIEEGSGFDVVNVLAHHVLAHVLSPRLLLRRIHEVLVPGGLLLLDEKDVLLPFRYKTRSVFDTGRAHQYYLTPATTEHYLRAAGFEVLECEIDVARVSDFHHVRVVARRPATAPARRAAPSPDPAELERVRKRLRKLEASWWMRSRFHGARHKLSKRLRRWRSGRQASNRPVGE